MHMLPQHDGNLETTVCRKPSNTDIYLQWDSHHAISNKYTLISTPFTEPKLNAQTNCYNFKSKHILKRCYKMQIPHVGT